MRFNPTSTNMVAVLVSTLAIVGIFSLVRKKYDSNVPLLFYFFAVPFTNMFNRPVDPALMYGSLAFALLLRFEFMGASFTKFIAFMASFGLGIMVWALMSDAVI
jgi:hypothetical protein